MQLKIQSKICPELEITFNDKVKNISIINSYTIRDNKIKQKILEEINQELKNNNIAFNRTINSQRIEWKGHNVLYRMNYEPKRTGSVDINEDETFVRRILYGVLSIFE